MTIYRIANNVDFEILKGPLGAAVSGGADSALMLYFMLKYTSDPVHIFTFASREKFLKNPMVSIAVVSKCIELTGNANVQHHISYGNSQNKINLFELPANYLKSHIVHNMYTGVTKNPPADIVATFSSENTENAAATAYGNIFSEYELAAWRENSCLWLPRLSVSTLDGLTRCHDK